jgi:hypothetical protein
VKNALHGKAKILTQAEIQILFSQGFQEARDSEALLLTADLHISRNALNNERIGRFRRASTRRV